MKTLFFILFIFLSIKTFSQWNVDPAVNTPVGVQTNDQKNQRIVTDTKGGAIIVWEDFRNSTPGGNADIYVQRIDKNGYVKWTTNGINICSDPNDQGTVQITEDGYGGTIIAWNDHRAGNRDIYAQRIDSSGNVKWIANGVAVAAKANDQRDCKLINDGTGGAIIVWQDSIGASWDIYAQRISGTGTAMWTAGGVPVCVQPYSQLKVKLRTDGAGGAIVVWQDHRSNDPKVGGEYDIYAQRINSSGAVQWAANGVFVRSMLNISASNPSIESDGAGGAVIVWLDKRSNGTDTTGVYAQRVNASGVMQWATNGIPICTAAGAQSSLDVTPSGTGGIIIAWKDKRSGLNNDIYAQKLNLNGTLAWAVNGVPISTANYDQSSPGIVDDGAGGAIIAYQDSSAGTEDITSSKIDANGVVLWTVPVGIAKGSGKNHQTNPKVVSDGSGGCIYVFQDERSADMDLYAHRILAGGTPAAVNEFSGISSEIICYPNPFSEYTTVLFKTINLIINYELNVYDIYGSKLSVDIVRNTNGFVMYRGNLVNGIYFYEIKTNDKKIVFNGKFIITK